IPLFVSDPRHLLNNDIARRAASYKGLRAFSDADRVFAGKGESMLLIELHPHLRIRKAVRPVEAVPVELAGLDVGVYARIAVIDLAAFRHAPEQGAAAIILEEGRSEVYELPVYVMFRNREGNLIEICVLFHCAAFLTTSSSVIPKK